MSCPTCNNETEPGAQFCGICGTELSSGEVVTGPEQPMVSFAEAISRGFSNYFEFSGRAPRAEHWWWVLFIFLVCWIEQNRMAPLEGLFYYRFRLFKPQTMQTWDSADSHDSAETVKVSLKYEVFYFTLIGRVMLGPLEKRISEANTDIKVNLQNFNEYVECL